MNPDCARVRSQQGLGPLSPDLERHARGCPRCQVFLVAPPAPKLDQMSAALKAALQDPAPARNWWNEAVPFWSVLLAVLSIASWALYSPGPGQVVPWARI